MITIVCQVKLLGLHVDNKLNFNNQITQFVKSLVEKQKFYQGCVMSSTNPVRFYSAIDLLNVILIIVSLYIAFYNGED